MNLKKRITFSLSLFSVSFFLTESKAQITGGTVSGNTQIDAQYYMEDTTIDAEQPEEKMLMNGFTNINYATKEFSAGFRYEAYLNPLLGYPIQYEGQGVWYRYANYRKEQFEITVGSFYEQFGQGMIFRTYEERTLGYDNAMDGFRVRINPYKGIYLKGVYGTQRYFWSRSPGTVRGFDGEIMLNELLDSVMADKKLKVTIGGSFVSKYEDPSSVVYVFPANVGCYGGRINLQHGETFNLYAEYAYKINDPSRDNNYIYKPGQGLLIQSSYSVKGFGISGAIKYIDNMSYRSKRDEGLANVLINYNPALTRPHTYNLAATLYPYASQLNGEFALQAEATYKLKKGTPLGGKYGAIISVNFSQASSIDTVNYDVATDTMRLGYTSRFFSRGTDLYFQDFNVEIRRKINDKFKIVLMYMNVIYDKEVIQSKPGEDQIYAHIGVIDFNWKINKKHNLRFETQALFTKQDHQDWVTGLVEYTVSPHWFAAALMQYNYGNIHDYDRDKYPYYSIGYINGSNRISIGYGKQRAGLFCVGGVCRQVPASSGFTVSVTSSF